MRYAELIWWIGCSVVFGLVCSSTGASPAALDTGPVSLFISLNSSSVTLGEPVILGYCLRNQSAWNSLTMDLGKDQEGWLTVNVMDSSGKAAPVIPDRRPKGGGGFSVLPSNDVKPRDCHVGNLVIGRQYAILSPGEYRIEVKAKVPYQSEKKEQVGVFTTTQVMLLEVTKKDTAQLKKTAAELADIILDGKDMELRTVAIQALFSMPQTETLSTWKTLVDPKLQDYDMQQITDELLRIGSAETADILAAIWLSPDMRQDVRHVAETALLNVWWAGDDALKKRIEAMYTAQGKTIPKMTNPLVPMD